MGEKADICPITSDPGQILDYDRGLAGNRLPQLDITVEPVDAAAQLVACSDVHLGRRSDNVAREFDVQRGTLHDRKGLTGLEPNRCVEAERPIVIRRLD